MLQRVQSKEGSVTKERSEKVVRAEAEVEAVKSCQDNLWKYWACPRSIEECRLARRAIQHHSPAYVCQYSLGLLWGANLKDCADIESSKVMATQSPPGWAQRCSWFARRWISGVVAESSGSQQWDGNANWYQWVWSRKRDYLWSDQLKCHPSATRWNKSQPWIRTVKS